MVEETISLSSIQHETKKIIQLKPIKKLLIEQNLDFESELQMDLQRIQEAKDELNSIYKQKEKLILETENKIEQAKKEWVEERNLLVEQAKEEGFQAGFEQGRLESLEQFNQLIEQANSIILASKKDYQVTVEKSEETILALAVQVAKKIMKQELKEQPESFLSIVKEAITSIKDQRELAIYLHPDNYEDVLSQKNELERVVDSKAEVSLLINNSLEVGSCVIEYPFGKIDASIDTQLHQIKQVLHEIVMESRE